ncbi:sensor histidine kinase [Rhizohabitans arisaemae]|uniref:sensor histidine kinase n=1 Tax=Rhizohabitans arisaemae TaxID=2720610 RepID=UPI0024B2360E|nr:histidine kinase [Rhizohabitans arisaemae]
MTNVPRRLLPAELAVLEGWSPGRRTVRDWAADTALFALAVLVAVEQAREFPPPGVDFIAGWQIAVNPWVGAAACLALWWRRRFPVALAVGMVPALALSASAIGAVAVSLLTLAAHRPWPRAAVMTGLCLLTVGYYTVYSDVPGESRPVIAAMLLLVFGGPFCLGMVVRARRLLLISLHRDAEVTERRHRLRLDEARRDERERLAREMHDVLAHRISLLSVHAGALAYRTSQAKARTGPPLQADEVDEAVTVILGNARLALDELREVLSILRVGEGADPGSPAPPGLSDLPRLIDEAGAAGQRVRLAGGETIERAAALRPHLQHTVYRTVQEGLTNARKHTPGARVTVSVDGEPGDRLVVTVENPLPAGSPPRPASGTGNGLAGLAERVTLGGGSLDHGPKDGLFRLVARLPWQT